MKKKLSLFCTVLSMALLSACGGNETQQVNQPTNEGSSGQQPKEAAVNSQDVITLGLGHATSGSKDSPHQQGAEKFKELVEQKTGGKVKIEIHPDAQLGGERELTEAVQIGTVDLVLTSSGPLGNFAPLSNALDFPFLFRDTDHARKVYDGEVGNEISKQLEDTGLKVLAYMEGGFRHITSSKGPITKPEDLKGIKIRTMENKVHLAAFQALSASPTPMSFSELYTSLQQGVVDAQETPITVIYASKFAEVQKYLSLTGHLYTPFPLIINKGKFEQLSPEFQQAILEAASEARDYEREFVTKMENEYLNKLKEEGMQISDNVDKAAFQKAVEPVYKEYEEQYGEMIRKVLDVK